MNQKEIGKHSVKALWSSFLEKNPDNKSKEVPISFYFCDNKKDADECAQLVMDGVKRATSTSMWWFETYEQPLPKIGNIGIITNWEGIAKAIIKTIKINFKSNSR